MLDVLSPGGAGGACPVGPPDCAERSGGESTWIATGFTPISEDGPDGSAGAGSEPLPSCGMGGRVFSKSLSPCNHTSHDSVHMDFGARRSTPRVASYIARSKWRTLDDCRPASNPRMANTVPLLTHLADSMAPSSNLHHGVHGSHQMAGAVVQKPSTPAKAGRHDTATSANLDASVLPSGYLKTHSLKSTCFCSACGTVRDGTPRHASQQRYLRRGVFRWQTMPSSLSPFDVTVMQGEVPSDCVLLGHADGG